MKKLFVGNLSWDVTDESLRLAFERFGEISEARVIRDRETGRSRGFGFVTFVASENADRAITELDGASLEGRNIKVTEAQERAPRSGGDRGGEGFRGGRPQGEGSGRGGQRDRW